MRFIRSPTKCAKIFALSCLVTFIGLQLLGSISLLSGNEPHVSSNIHEIKNVGGKNLKDLKIEIINSNLERVGNKDDNGRPKIDDNQEEEKLKLPSINDVGLIDSDNNIYKEHSEVPLVNEDQVPPSGDTGQQQIRVEEDDSLAGKRTHGLPNITGGNAGKNKNNGKDPAKTIKKTEVSRILERIEIINSEQSVKNEDIFGPVDNNGTLAVIVVQVHNRIQYLRQLIISFSQAKDIDHTLIIFSHDVWDDEVNELINSIDFAKILQIYYPYSIQTHSNSFPGESPNDCPRNAKKDQAERMGCVNSKWPDLYGHYREAKFTQTKHHWWWKANRIYNELRVTKNYDGLVLFLEEDHYVAEDFLGIMSLMKHERDLHYPNCDIICLGTYLKQTNYKDDHKKMAPGFPGILGRTGYRGFPHAARRMLSYQEQEGISNLSDSSHKKAFRSTTTKEHPKSKVQFRALKAVKTTRQIKSFREKSVKNQRHLEENNFPDNNGIFIASNSSHSVYPYENYPMKYRPKGPRRQRSLLWSPPQIFSSVLKVFRKDFQLWPGGPNFSQHQRVELTQWLSSKHNMGMAFTRAVWKKIHLCAASFCQFDDYNWDWSLFHVSMTCLKQKLHVMLIKGPRVFHIGECGVHHKKAQCDTEKVVKKVQAILEKANPYLYPKNLIVTTLQPKKNAKLPKGNGGWGDKRDQLMCLNMSTFNSTLLHEQLGESFGL